MIVFHKHLELRFAKTHFADQARKLELHEMAFLFSDPDVPMRQE